MHSMLLQTPVRSGLSVVASGRLSLVTSDLSTSLSMTLSMSDVKRQIVNEDITHYMPFFKTHHVGIFKNKSFY